jgi:hypothetical protein
LSSCGSVASADVTNTDYDEDAIDYITNHLRRQCEIGERNGDVVNPSGFRICRSSADSASESASDSADSVHDSDEEPAESDEEAERHINFAAQSEGDFQRYLASVRECADEDSLSADGLKRKFFRIRSKSSKATEKLPIAVGDTTVFPRRQFGDTSKYEVVDEYSCR